MTDAAWQARHLGVELRWSRLPSEVVPADLAVLAATERSRASRFKVQRRRVEYVGSHAFLRRSLAAVLGVEPGAIPIEPDDFGKPQHGGALQFNLAHSAGAVLIGWGAAPLGVDLEAAGRTTRRIARVRIVADVAAALAIGTIEAFTLVEAAAKAVGRGLGAIGGLQIEGIAAGEIRLRSPVAQSPIRAVSVSLPDGYVGAVAVVS